ncbi:CAP Gly-rich domain-containing protein, partial [Ochromonadaceae sp. CCMP2298]
GLVAFVGPVHYAKGVYVGVVMDSPEAGKNKGTIKGTEYFTCPGRSMGLMVTLNEIQKI